jgi:hypothetical protein
VWADQSIFNIAALAAQIVRSATANFPWRKWWSSRMKSALQDYANAQSHAQEVGGITNRSDPQAIRDHDAATLALNTEAVNLLTVVRQKTTCEKGTAQR